MALSSSQLPYVLELDVEQRGLEQLGLCCHVTLSSEKHPLPWRWVRPGENTLCRIGGLYHETDEVCIDVYSIDLTPEEHAERDDHLRGRMSSDTVGFQSPPFGAPPAGSKRLATLKPIPVRSFLRESSTNWILLFPERATMSNNAPAIRVGLLSQRPRFYSRFNIEVCGGINLLPQREDEETVQSNRRGAELLTKFDDFLCSIRLVQMKTNTNKSEGGTSVNLKMKRCEETPIFPCKPFTVSRQAHLEQLNIDGKTLEEGSAKSVKSFQTHTVYSFLVDDISTVGIEIKVKEHGTENIIGIAKAGTPVVRGLLKESQVFQQRVVDLSQKKIKSFQSSEKFDDEVELIQLQQRSILSRMKPSALFVESKHPSHNPTFSTLNEFLQYVFKNVTRSPTQLKQVNSPHVSKMTLYALAHEVLSKEPLISIQSARAAAVAIKDLSKKSGTVSELLGETADDDDEKEVIRNVLNLCADAVAPRIFIKMYTGSDHCDALQLQNEFRENSMRMERKKGFFNSCFLPSFFLSQFKNKKGKEIFCYRHSRSMYCITTILFILFTIFASIWIRSIGGKISMEVNLPKLTITEENSLKYATLSLSGLVNAEIKNTQILPLCISSISVKAAFSPGPMSGVEELAFNERESLRKFNGKVFPFSHAKYDLVHRFEDMDPIVATRNNQSGKKHKYCLGSLHSETFEIPFSWTFHLDENLGKQVEAACSNVKPHDNGFRIRMHVTVTTQLDGRKKDKWWGLPVPPGPSHTYSLLDVVPCQGNDVDYRNEGTASAASSLVSSESNFGNTESSEAVRFNDMLPMIENDVKSSPLLMNQDF